MTCTALDTGSLAMYGTHSAKSEREDFATVVAKYTFFTTHRQDENKDWCHHEKPWNLMFARLYIQSICALCSNAHNVLSFSMWLKNKVCLVQCIHFKITSDRQSFSEQVRPWETIALTCRSGFPILIWDGFQYYCHGIFEWLGIYEKAHLFRLQHVYFKFL